MLSRVSYTLCSDAAVLAWLGPQLGECGHGLGHAFHHFATGGHDYGDRLAPGASWAPPASLASEACWRASHHGGECSGAPFGHVPIAASHAYYCGTGVWHTVRNLHLDRIAPSLSWRDALAPCAADALPAACFRYQIRWRCASIFRRRRATTRRRRRRWSATLANWPTTATAAGATAARRACRAHLVSHLLRCSVPEGQSICEHAPLLSVVPYLASHAGDATAISTAFGARFGAADAPDALLEPALHDLAKYNAAKLAAMCSNLTPVGFGDASRERCLFVLARGHVWVGRRLPLGYVSAPGRAGAPPMYCSAVRNPKTQP